MPRTLHTLQRGRAWPFSRPDRHQSIHRGSRSHADRRAHTHQANVDLSLPPRSIHLDPGRGSGSVTKVSGSIHSASGAWGGL